MIGLLKADFIKLKYSGMLWLATVGTVITNVMLLLLFVNFGNDKSISEFLNVKPSYSWAEWLESHYDSTTPMLLPMFIVILCALSIAQESRANTWKQIYTLPVRKSVIYINKLLTVVVVFAGAHFLFVIGMMIGPFIVDVEMTESLPIGQISLLYCTTVISSFGIIGLIYLASYYVNSFIFPLALGILGFVLAQLMQDYNLNTWWWPFLNPNDSIESVLAYAEVPLLPVISSISLFIATTLLGAYFAHRRRFRN